MVNADSGAGHRAVFGVTAAYVLAVAAFWLLFVLNGRHPWVSRRVLLISAISIGLLMCVAGLSSAMLARRKLHGAAHPAQESARLDRS